MFNSFFSNILFYNISRSLSFSKTWYIYILSQSLSCVVIIVNCIFSWNFNIYFYNIFRLFLNSCFNLLVLFSISLYIIKLLQTEDIVKLAIKTAQVKLAPKFYTSLNYSLSEALSDAGNSGAPNIPSISSKIAAGFLAWFL